MIKFKNAVRAAIGVLALLVIAPSSAQVPEKKQTVSRILKRPAVEKKLHRLILQVNTNEPAMMNLAGLHMLRDDTSPVKARIKAIVESTPAISFKACGNTQENMHKAENKDIPLIPEAKVVKSGVVRVMELQEQGWTYVKP